MTPLITCKQISKTYGSEALFEEMSITFSKNCKSGLVGPNGAGKSTLLKILAGKVEVDEGEIAAQRTLKVAYVPQIRHFGESDTIKSILLQSALGSGQDEITAETNVAIVCSKIGFEDPDLRALELSGGWQKRLSIFEGIITEPDLLLLDEPTNHLDFDGFIWLEDVLAYPDFSWVLVSHDRYFLDRVSKDIVEINPCYPEGYLRTAGGYKDHVKHKDDVFTALESREQNLSSKVRRENAWLERGPKARSTKAKSRIDAAYALQSELKALRSLKPKKAAGVDFTASSRKTKSLITLKNADIGYSNKVMFKSLNLSIEKSTRLGILGSNGTGKTTILKSLLGELPVISGTFKQADSLSIVYFSQARDELNPSHTLKRVMGDGQEQVIFRDRSVHIVSWAKRFGFAAEDLTTLVKDLSGGQLAKLHISLLMLKSADILFLDEPTNDLDLDTIEVLESSLASFPGAVILISHDRSFLDNVCKNYLAIDSQGNHTMISSFSQWRPLEKIKKEKPETKSAQVDKSQPSEAINSGGKKLSFKDQFELSNIEEKIALAENQLDSLTTEVERLSTGSDHEKLLKASESLEVAQKKVTDLYARWEYLESLKN